MSPICRPSRVTFFASFLHPFFKCMLEHILHRCWSQLGVQNRANLGPCWPLLSIFSGVHLEMSPSAPYPIIYNTKWSSGHPKSRPKSIKNWSKRCSRSIRKLIAKIVAIGIDFVTIFGPFWLPTWGPRGVQRITSEIDPSAPYPIIYHTKWPSGKIEIQQYSNIAI